MTYHSDPTRWTQSPGEAPELLRGGLEAAGREGPSELQMRTLALKLAAVGTGAAIAAGAAGAKASTTAAGAGAGLAATGSSLMTKVVVSVALIGAAATGGTVLLRQPSQEAQRAPVIATPSMAQPVVEPQIAPGQPIVTPKEPSVPASPAAEAVRPQRAPVVQQPSSAARSLEAEQEHAFGGAPAARALHAPEREAIAATDEPDNRAERRERRHARAAVLEREQPASEPATTETVGSRNVPKISQVTGEKPQLSEIDLLTKARSALAARPREAYRLTEEHRDLYPSGVFAQERDALAVEALLRAGDTKRARERAGAFLERYPSSPAAHRFRETLNLP